MLQRIIAILLMSMLTFNTFSRIGIVVYYQLNKEYIATKLCINKSKPQLQCNGTCYLTKKLKEQERKQAHLPALLKKLPEIIWFCSTPLIPLIRLSGNSSLPASSGYLLKRYNSPLLSIFQPPKF